MTIKRRVLFDPKSFLAKVGEGLSIGEYREDQIVFSQGDPADSVFYIPGQTAPAHNPAPEDAPRRDR